MSDTKPTRKTRKDPRKEATRQILIETAESLFGTYGIDSVSIRQIGSAIGSSNPSVVGYHFGTKEDLIIAIFRYRLPWLEQRRGELYEMIIGQSSRSELHQLVYAMWYPLFEQVNAESAHSFAAFLAELVRTGRGNLRQQIALDYPATERISSEIEQCLSAGTRQFAQSRMGMMATIITSQLRIIDQQRHGRGISDSEADALFNDALTMVCGALTAG